jgi:hypothetical protein
MSPSRSPLDNAVIDEDLARNRFDSLLTRLSEPLLRGPIQSPLCSAEEACRAYILQQAVMFSCLGAPALILNGQHLDARTEWKAYLAGGI